MAQILPSQPTLAGELGRGLGAGIQDLAQRKLSALHQQEERGRLAQLFSKVKTPSGEPISSEYAELIPNLPQNQWLSAIQSLKGSGAPQEQPSGQQQAAYQPGQIAQKLQQFSQASKEQEPNLSPLQLMKFLQAPEAQKQTEAQALSVLNPNDIFERAALKGIEMNPEEKQQIMKDIETINGNQALRKEIEPLIQKLQQQQQAQQPQEQVQAAAKPTGQYFEKPLTEKEKLAHQQRVQQAQEAKQKSIDVKNAPAITKRTEAGNVGNQLDKHAAKLYDLWKTGKIASSVVLPVPETVLGLYGDTGEFQSEAKDAVALLSKNQGVATQFKIKFNEQRKPTTAQTHEVQGKRIKSMFEESRNGYLPDEIQNKLILDNEGKQPDNLTTLVAKNLNYLQKEINTLPEPYDLPDGSIARDETTNEPMFEVKNHNWHLYQG